MRVVILAQGQQTRIGDPRVVGYKQLLPLPECGGVPIIVRTYCQVRLLSPPGVDFGGIASARPRVVVVGWSDIHLAIAGSQFIKDPFIMVREDFVSLPKPGNSSLRGIRRALDLQLEGEQREDTVVLLGDVVYSWACLRALFRMAMTGGFVGTADLSNDGGELWGVAWPGSARPYMISELDDALLRHPPFEDTYQCGQLRRWVSGFRRGDLRSHVVGRVRDGSYVAIDDYTRDIDTREHMGLIPGLSVAAAADDRAHGLLWNAPAGETHGHE